MRCASGRLGYRRPSLSISQPKFGFILGGPRVAHHGSNYSISHNQRHVTHLNHTSIIVDPRLEFSPSKPYSLQTHDSSRQRRRVHNSSTVALVEKLSLNGNFDLVLQLVRRLDHPEMMDEMTLTVFYCTAEDVTGPYVRDYFRRDRRFRDGIGILATSLSGSISIQASTISSVEGPTQKVTFATFAAIPRESLPPCRGEAAHRFYRTYSERTLCTSVGTRPWMPVVTAMANI